MIEAPAKLPQRTERLLEKSGRITPREVLEAYEETGVTPRAGTFIKGGKACAIGVVMLRDGVELGDLFSDSIDRWWEQKQQIAGAWYLVGLYKGFDGLPERYIGSADWRGYRDGQRARRFVESRYGRFS